MISYPWVFAFFLSPLAFSLEQVPPLTPVPGEECHIANARPLLAKEKYGAGYTLKELRRNPITLLETIALEGGGELKIEHRGCEDIYFRFRLKRLKAEGAEASIQRLAGALQKLKLAKDPMLNSKQLGEIADQAKSGAKQAKGFTVCLMKIPSECITDLKVSLTGSDVEFFYVDRP